MSVLLLLLILLVPATARAQRGDSVPSDSVFARAQRLASEGETAAGRKLVDSVLAASSERSPVYADALFWRASLAETAADAERDYRRISVEFPLSPRAEDALMRLAQLEMARGDRALALRHIERLVLEHPQSPQLPRAHFWQARVLLEDSNLPRACAALGRARAGVAPGDAELRNQIDFYGKRCYGIDTSASMVAATAAPSTPSVPPAASEPGAAARAPRPTPSRARADSAVTRSTAARPALSDTGGVAESAPVTTSVPASAPVSTPATDTAPSETGASAAASAPPAAATTPRSTRSSGRYTVQVAAFNTRAPAAQLRDRLAARGYQARVVGSAAPFRVRVGYYGTYAQARAMADQMRTKAISALAIEAEPR